MKDMNELNAIKFANMVIKDREKIKMNYNRAIEYARHKTGMRWDSNRQRISFYKYFHQYLSLHNGLDRDSIELAKER